MANTAAIQSPVRWSQLWALLGLDVAIIISWIAYHEYQPLLLEQFGFQSLTLFLAIAQCIVLFVTPPVAGYLSDRIRQKKGDRLPVITAGISLVSMVFMAVAVVIYSNPSSGLKFIFPVLVAVWLVAMNLFHSPAISTVEMFVPVERLPSIMAIFLVAGDMANAIEPVIVPILKQLGAPITFGIGGVLVFSTGFIFLRTTRKMDAPVPNSVAVERKSQLGLVLVLGLLFGAATLYLFKILPDLGKENRLLWPIGNLSPRAACSILIAFTALITYPIGRKLDGKNLWPFVGIGALVSLGSALLIPFSAGAISLSGCILFCVGFALLTVTLLPLAFQNLGRKHFILGVGLFFAGVELPSSIMDILQALNP